MARYIDADKLIGHLKDLIEECENPNVDTQPITYGTVLGLKGALSFAETLPTADVVEVKHGEWVGGEFNNYSGEYEEQCSNCKKFSREYTRPYCPNCGAKMDGGSET